MSYNEASERDDHDVHSNYYQQLLYKIHIIGVVGQEVCGKGVRGNGFNCRSGLKMRSGDLVVWWGCAGIIKNK